MEISEAVQLAVRDYHTIAQMEIGEHLASSNFVQVLAGRRDSR